MSPRSGGICRSIAIVAVLLLQSHAASGWSRCDWDAYTWPADSCEMYHWDFDPSVQILLRWSSEGQQFTSHQKDIVRQAMEMYNHLPHARLNIVESITSCDHTQHPSNLPDDVLCIGTSTGSSAGAWGRGDVCDGSTQVYGLIDKCRIRIITSVLNDDTTLYMVAAHEMAHCLGLDHTPNGSDWMSAGIVTIPPEDDKEDLGISRDTENGISYLYPFGRNFFFGNFDRTTTRDYSSAYRDDVIARDNSNSGNTVPWRSAGYYTDGQWRDVGTVDSDFGNETTLAYVVGDFTGDNLPDLATGLCTSDPGDGVPDNVAWYVDEGYGTYGFGYTSMWTSNWGDAEDFDQYRSGDFSGDGCDDLWLIRNESEADCLGDSSPPECSVRVYVLLAGDTGGAPLCDDFVSQYSRSIGVSDRSAASAWPWVVGDFDQDGSSEGCDDIAFGEVPQDDPLDMHWWVMTATDSNSDGECDTLGAPTLWATGRGASGQTTWFAGAFKGDSADDLVRVRVNVNGQASWAIMESNGSDGFNYISTVVSDMRLTSGELHWAGKVFGVGNFNGSGFDDFVTVTDESVGDDLEITMAMNSGGSTWSVGSTIELPGDFDWALPTDWDDQVPVSRDNGGDDAKDAWWCQTCDVWYNYPP